VKKKMNKDKDSPFGRRLREAFEGKTNGEIATILECGDSTISTYMSGRIPPALTLVKISNTTGYSIHWLITEKGEKVVKEGSTSEVETLMNRIARKAERLPTEQHKDFILKSAEMIERYIDAQISDTSGKKKANGS
jgi:hypothetical protein